MIEIKKSAPLPELVELQNKVVCQKLTANDAYKELSGTLKKRVVEQLMQDQGHLCAYCMRRIPDKRDFDHGVKEPLEFKIEHWVPRSDPSCGSFGALDYNNLLVVCSGNQNGKLRGKSKLTCDAKRGNRKLTVNPLDASTLLTIYYTEDGIIKASDSIINEDLDIGLNLNCMKDAVMLPVERKKVLDAIEAEINDEVQAGDSLLEACKRLYRSLLGLSGEKPPYVGIALWWLKSTIHQIEHNT